MNDRIVWTATERKDVAAESFRLAQKDPDLSVLAAASRAQLKVLPEGRRRSLHDTKALQKWLAPLWDEMRAAAEAAPKRAEARRQVEALFEPEPVALKETPPVAVDEPKQDEPTETPAVVEPDDARPSSTEAAPPRYKDFDIAKRETEQSILKRHAERDAARKTSTDVSALETELIAIQAASKPRSSVFWRDEEKRKVTTRAYSNLQRWPDMSRLEAVRKAQDSELPDDRRRNLSTWEMVRDWAEPMLESLALDEQIEAARLAEENERAREAARAEAAEAEAARLRAEVAAKDAALAFETAVQKRMESLTLDDMFKAMTRRMAREAVAAFSEEIEGLFARKVKGILSAALDPEPSPPNKPEPPAPVALAAPKNRLPRVCVVGLLNQQAQDVERAFLGSIEFVFVQSQQTGGSGNHGGKGMLSKATRCDVVVGMIDHAGHDVDECAKKLDGIPYKRVPGSVSALKRWLHLWLETEVKKAA